MKINAEEKKLLDAIHEKNLAQLKIWQAKLDEATQQTDYWKRQVEASSILGTRAVMDSWSDHKPKNPNPDATP